MTCCRRIWLFIASVPLLGTAAVVSLSAKHRSPSSCLFVVGQLLRGQRLPAGVVWCWSGECASRVTPAFVLVSVGTARETRIIAILDGSVVSFRHLQCMLYRGALFFSERNSAAAKRAVAVQLIRSSCRMQVGVAGEHRGRSKEYLLCGIISRGGGTFMLATLLIYIARVVTGVITGA